MLCLYFFGGEYLLLFDTLACGVLFVACMLFWVGSYLILHLLSTQQRHARQANRQPSVAVGACAAEDSCLSLFGPAKNCRLVLAATLPFVPRQLS